MSQASPDKSLVVLDEASFTEIYNIYWKKVYSISMAKLNDSDLAKGIVQEVFKSLWERRDSIDVIREVEHYLVRSAKLKTLEYLRNKSIRAKHHEMIAMKQTAAYEDTESEIISSNLLDNISPLIESLPPKCKEVFKMSREHELSNKEIASMLLISERAVGQHISKAVSFLRLRLERFSF